MEYVVYTLLGLAVIGALVYALYQVNLRQKRLDAEMTRLEQLTAEVAMNAEAVLEQVDQRVEKLNQLAAAMEARAQQAPALAPPEKPQLDVLVGEAQVFALPEAEVKPAKPKRTRKAKVDASPAPASAEAPAPETQPTAEAKPKRGGRKPKAKAESAPSAASAPELPATPANPDRYGSVREAVYARADQGEDPVAIAAALGIPRGEVMLLLNLRSKQSVG